MRYFYERPELYSTDYTGVYCCNHIVYSSCTLLKFENKGLAVIQQRYNPENKHTWWSKVDPWLIENLYSSALYNDYLKAHAKEPINGLYPTVTIRQIMWALKMKPIKRQPWETVFDKSDF